MPHLKKMGIKTAHKMLQKYGSAEKVVRVHRMEVCCVFRFRLRVDLRP